MTLALIKSFTLLRGQYLKKLLMKINLIWGPNSKTFAFQAHA